MRSQRVRAVLVIQGDDLAGIVTQGDCAIKVLLPGLESGRVVGVVSIGDGVKDNIRQLGQRINLLETYIKGHGA